MRVPRRISAAAIVLAAIAWPRPARAAPPTSEAVEGPAPAADEADEASEVDETDETDESDEADGTRPPARRPARVSGTYLGMAIWPGVSWAFSPNLEVDQSGALGGGGGALRLGQAVLPWLTLGVDGDGGFYFAPDRFFMNGGFMVEAGFYPAPRYPLSIRAGFGFGVGLLLDDRTEVRGGVGGPKFMGSVRYEFFPGADRRRPKRPGGWVLGPELGWRGFTPAAAGRPMSNTVFLGVWFGHYWGK